MGDIVLSCKKCKKPLKKYRYTWKPPGRSEIEIYYCFPCNDVRYIPKE